MIRLQVRLPTNYKVIEIDEAKDFPIYIKEKLPNGENAGTVFTRIDREMTATIVTITNHLGLGGSHEHVLAVRVEVRRKVWGNGAGGIFYGNSASNKALGRDPYNSSKAEFESAMRIAREFVSKTLTAEEYKL